MNSRHSIRIMDIKKNMSNLYLRTITSIIEEYPSVVPYLTGKAALIYCEHKAVERDIDEPGREEKVRIENKLKRLIAARMRRQFEEIQKQLEDNYKAIISGGAMIFDEGGENAELIALFYEALLSGVELTQGTTGIYLSDGAINEPALRAARTYVTDWLAQLDTTSQNAVRVALDTFIRQPGATLGDVVDLLSPTFGTDRAWRIAVTETTRIYAAANDLYAVELQKEFADMQVYKTWFTNADDRVCPICAPLHNKVVKGDETFDGIDKPPAHVNCRCWTSVTVKA